jgi:hypothetical protein
LILEYYPLFALTTGLIACYKLYAAVIEQLKTTNSNSTLVEYTFVGYITFLILSMLVAPIIFLVIISPSLEQKFIDSMVESIEKP